MIHACYGLHDKDGRYSKFTGTSMLSMLDNSNTPPHSLTVHILHDNTLTQANRDKFIYIAGQYNQHVNFYNVKELCADKITHFLSLFPNAENHYAGIGMIYRLLAIQLLPTEIKKLIYLDSDTIVNLDINEFWQLPLQNNILGAISEKSNGVFMQGQFAMCRDNLVKEEDYFNSGVLLMNLELLRSEYETVSNGFEFVAKNPQYIFFDQDVLNYCFSTRTVKLPIKFNRFVNSERLEGSNVVDSKIYHYAGGQLNLDLQDTFNRLFMRYFVKTPWFNEDTIGHLYEGTRQIYIDQKNFAIKISAILSGKIRAFFTSQMNVEVTKTIFFVNANEEFIVEESPESLQKVADSLKASRGNKLFIIITDSYPVVHNILTQDGFIYEKDFINGLNFLSDANGVPLNSNFLMNVL